MRKLLSVLLPALLIPAVSFGKLLSLKVISDESKSPLPAILHLESDNMYSIDSICDAEGRFQIQIPDSVSNIIMDISYEGFVQSIINLTDGQHFEIGTVFLHKVPKMLEEVTVVANNTSVKAGKRTIFPTLQQTQRNYNSMQLLSDLQSSAPELQVNPILRTISIDGETPVFQINGRTQNADRLIDIRPERIERIEMTNYRDPRYEAPVFNIILKPAPAGGSVSIYSQDPITTPKSYTKATGTFNYKNSEFLFDYKFVYRNSTDEILNDEESYLWADSRITRRSQGLPSSTIDQNHNFLLEYTLIPNNNSMLVLSGDADLHRNHNSSGAHYTQIDNMSDNENDFDSWNKRRYWRTPFSFSAFYRLQKNIHKIEMSASLSRANGEYNRELSYSDGYSSISYSKNKGTSYSANVNYDLQLPSNLGFTAEVTYSYNLANSDFYQSGYPDNESSMHSNQVYVYGKLSWYNRGFSIVGGPGIRYHSSFNGSSRENYCRWRGVVSVTQNINRSLYANYSVTLDPSFPSLTQTSIVPQTLNDYSVHIGNPYVKSSLSIYQSFRLNYRLKNFRISPYAYYYYSHLPILEYWYYSDDDKLYVQTYGNGDNSHNLTAALNLSLSNILGKINLTADVGYKRFWLNMDNTLSTKGHLFCKVNASAYIGKFYFSLNLCPVRDLQYQGNSYVRNQAFNAISAFYRYRGFQFGVTWQNPLTSRAALTQTYYISQVHPKYSEYYIKDFNNMVLLSLQYNVSFGRSYKKPNITTQKSSVTDIIKAY